MGVSPMELRLRFRLGSKLWVPFLVFVASPGVPVRAQVEFQFSGYVVNLPIYERENASVARLLLNLDQNQVLDLTRLRLRPSLLPWDGATLGLEYEGTALYHNTSLSGFLTTTTLRRQLLDLKWDPVNETHLAASHFIDRLYFRQNFQSASLIIGRQRIAWGTGRIWNPTDLFNPINPASFEKIEKDGADAVSFKYYFASFTDLEVVYNPEDHFKRWNAAFRFRTNYDEYDVSVMGGYFDKRLVAGGDFAGNLFDAGFRGEGIYWADTKDLNNSFVKLILGLDYQFTAKLYGLVEYQYNGEGQTDKNKYELPRLFTGEILNLSRHYLFVNATYQIHPLVNTSIGFNVNMNDGSGFVLPQVTYSARSDIDLSLGGLIAYGNQRSEYWYYPTSLYAKGVWYF
jgi:hypothetical protein